MGYKNETLQDARAALRRSNGGPLEYTAKTYRRTSASQVENNSIRKQKM